MMGIIPLEYLAGESAASFDLDGNETFSIALPEEPVVKQLIEVTAQRIDGETVSFDRLRFDAPADIRYWKHQGILPMVIRKSWIRRNYMSNQTTHEATTITIPYIAGDGIGAEIWQLRNLWLMPL